MEIKKAVVAWTDEENIASGANQWFKIAMVVGVGGIGWAFYFMQPWALALTVGAFVGWTVLAPKPWHISTLLGPRCREIAPDGLLARLADDPKIPEWAKAEIGSALKWDGLVTFQSLFEIDAWIEGRAEKEELAKGRGYRKLANYARDGESTGEARTSEN